MEMTEKIINKLDERPIEKKRKWTERNGQSFEVLADNIERSKVYVIGVMIIEKEKGKIFGKKE